MGTSKLMHRAMLIISGLLLASGAVFAQDVPLLISNSRSPDGKLELWIKPPLEDEGVASGTVEIRKFETQKILSTFEWSGFGDRADSRAFTVLWRPDAKYFAITWELNRGYVTSAIYGLHKNGRWTKVKLPSDEYTNAIMKMSGVSVLRSGKGHETAKKWLTDGKLDLEFGSRDIPFEGAQEDENEYDVILQVNSKKGNPLPMARIISITLEPK